MIWLALFLIGGGAGLASGLFGIGGGLLIVPALVWVLGFSMQMAAGTSLIALMLPFGAAIGAYEYYAAGKISLHHFWYGLLICFGLAIGAFFGAKIAVHINQDLLRKIFAVFLMFAAILTWFKT